MTWAHRPRRSAHDAAALVDDGACGKAAIGPDGELSREPAVLEVQGHQLILAP